MNRIAAAGLVALLSISGCAQIEQPIQKEKTTQKIEQPPQKEKTTQKIPVPSHIQSQDKKSLDEMMISEEQTAYKNADALSRRIPVGFEKETFGEYILYHDKGITAGKQTNQDGSPKLNGKGRAVLIKGNTNLIAGYFNYASQGREKGIIPQGAEAKDLWRFAYVANSDLIAMSTGKSSFGYSKKGAKWSVMEINMTAFRTTQEFTKEIMSDSPEEMKITDLSKRPTRTRVADPDKVKKYQAVLGRFFDTYNPVKPQTQNTYEKPSGKSIDEIFKEGEERIYNQAKNVISNPTSGNLLKHRLDNGATVYHDSSLVFSGNKMSGSGNYIMQDKDGGVVVAFENTNVNYSNSPPERQERKGKEKQTSKTLTKTEAKQTPKTEAKPDPRNFIFVCKSNKITLINSDINITYFHAENNGWMKREMNPRNTGNEKEEAYLMEYISKGYDFKNTDLNKIPVRTMNVPPELIKRYISLKQMIDKAYPLEKRGEKRT